MTCNLKPNGARRETCSREFDHSAGRCLLAGTHMSRRGILAHQLQNFITETVQRSGAGILAIAGILGPAACRTDRKQAETP